MRDESHTEDIYLAARTREVRKHFPTALGVDDFLSRLEVSLFSYGFTGENAIAMSNLCRCGTYQRVRAAIHRAAGSIKKGGAV